MGVERGVAVVRIRTCCTLWMPLDSRLRGNDGVGVRWVVRCGKAIQIFVLKEQIEMPDVSLLTYALAFQSDG